MGGSMASSELGRQWRAGRRWMLRSGPVGAIYCQWGEDEHFRGGKMASPSRGRAPSGGAGFPAAAGSHGAREQRGVHAGC
jgi:hypothetical protein